MSARTNLRPQIVLNASMATSQVSQPTVMQSLSGVSYAYSWSGTSPVGTVSVQVSNDYTLNPNGTVENAGTWDTITVNLDGAPVQTIPITGNTGNGGVDVLKTMFYAIRTIYTATSGTGTITATVAGKVS